MPFIVKVSDLKGFSAYILVIPNVLYAIKSHRMPKRLS